MWTLLPTLSIRIGLSAPILCLSVELMAAHSDVVLLYAAPQAHRRCVSRRATLRETTENHFHTRPHISGFSLKALLPLQW